MIWDLLHRLRPHLSAIIVTFFGLWLALLVALEIGLFIFGDAPEDMPHEELPASEASNEGCTVIDGLQICE